MVQPASSGARCQTQEPSAGKFHIVLPFAPLFDHLVGTSEQRRWDFEVERLGGFQIDHQLVLGRGLYWQVGGFLAFEDAMERRMPSAGTGR